MGKGTEKDNIETIEKIKAKESKGEAIKITKDKQAVIRILAFILLGVIIIIFVSLMRNKTVNNVEEKITIGFCADTMVIERWQRDRDIFVAQAKERGSEVIVLNANENNERQKTQIKQLIDKNVDVIVVIPYDKNGLTDIIKEAKNTGIKVISYDRLIHSSDVDAYITFDNIKVGELMGEYIYNKVPNGNYVIINGSPADNNSFMFNEGYKKVLEEPIRKGDIVVVEEVWATDWREDVAYELINELLSKEVKIDAIIGANDRLAEAAIKALAENGLAGEIPVVGHDADISACQRIVEGTQLMTVYKPIKTLAEAAADMAIRMAQHEDIDIDEYINDGTYQVPYYRYSVVAVTKDNMKQTVIKDGFHSEESIFRNMN